jgi:hypothetical protein
MAENFSRMSDDRFNEQFEGWKREHGRRQALASLPNHEEVITVHEAITKAAEITGTDPNEVRLAEIRRFVDDFPEFVVKMNNELEKWKDENATYRNSDNPNEYWYAPDGSGNPPKWVRDIAGDKPKKENNPRSQKEMDAWLKKLDKFRVNGKAP